MYNDDNIRVGALSSFIVTEPYGPVEQDDFLNACVEIETLYSPEELLDKVHVIENEAGRTRDVHWGPRTLDIDIVLYEDMIINTKDLIVPHIEMHKRLFVLEPLAQIAPGLVHPVYRKTIADLKNELKENKGCGTCGGCECPMNSNG